MEQEHMTEVAWRFHLNGYGRTEADDSDVMRNKNNGDAESHKHK